MLLSVRHTVAEYAAWKRAFDEHVGIRKEHGASGHRLAVSLDDPNTVTALIQFPDRTKAEAFLADPRLREAMQRAGVVSEPDISLWDVTEEVPY